MANVTWNDEEMKEKLELMGYDLSDDNGEFSLTALVDIASNAEHYKWDGKRGVWYE